MIDNLATIFSGMAGDDLGWGAIIAFLGGFVIAQLWKFLVWIFTAKKAEKRNFKVILSYLTRSGGMPSGHTAGMAGATAFLGCYYGFGSGVFALAVAVTLIMAYDAMHVRYAVGEQGKALNKLLKQAKEPELKVVEGHTVLQVAVGMILGAIIGIGVFWLLVKG